MTSKTIKYVYCNKDATIAASTPLDAEAYRQSILIHFRASFLVLPGIVALKLILPLTQMTIPPPKRKDRG